jgi:hypothetical protein
MLFYCALSWFESRRLMDRCGVVVAFLLGPGISEVSEKSTTIVVIGLSGTALKHANEQIHLLLRRTEAGRHLTKHGLHVQVEWKGGRWESHHGKPIGRYQRKGTRHGRHYSSRCPRDLHVGRMCSIWRDLHCLPHDGVQNFLVAPSTV